MSDCIALYDITLDCITLHRILIQFIVVTLYWFLWLIFYQPYWLTMD